MPQNSEPQPPVDIVAAAHQRHVVVIGGGIAGLVAALECAKVGIRVTALEASAQFGGAVARADVGGLTVDAGATQIPSSAKAVRDLVAELGLRDEVVNAAQSALWVAGSGTLLAPLPVPAVLGIPANPWADDVRRIIGWGGAWRAYLDRLRPVLTIGTERRLDHLVRSRMGDKVADRLVAPIARGRFGMLSTDVDVDVAAPGLNQALTRTGSLSGAVGQLTDDVVPTPAWSIRGGLFTLVDALIERLSVLGAEVHSDAVVTGIVRRDGGWALELAPDAEDIQPEPIHADAVIIATGGAAARALLSPLAASASSSKLHSRTETAGEHRSLGAGVQSRGSETATDADADAGEGAVRVDVVTLRLDAPALVAAPRGAGVVTMAERPGAVAVEHLSAVWPWLSDQVVRVIFGCAGQMPETADLNNTEAIALARSEAAALFGVPVEELRVIAGSRASYWQELPASALDHSEKAKAARELVAKLHHLVVVGAAVSGAGIAQVVPDAQQVAEQLRRSLLWGNLDEE